MLHCTLSIVLVLFLKACTFQPLLKKQSLDQTTVPPLKIASIPDREGKQLYDLLSTLINPGGPPKESLYELNVAFTSSERGHAFSQSKVEQSKSVKSVAYAKLVSLKTSKVVWRQSFQAQGEYTVITEEGSGSYSNYISGNAAKEKTIQRIAEDIYFNLALFFSKEEGTSSSAVAKAS